MHPEMGYKLCKFYENRARDTPLWGVSIPHFDQISVKISVLGLLYPNTAFTLRAAQTYQQHYKRRLVPRRPCKEKNNKNKPLYL